MNHTTLFIRDALTLITGLHLTVDRTRVKKLVGQLTGTPDLSMQAAAKKAILSKLAYLGEGMPDTANLKSGEKQRVMLDWANQKIADHVSRHGDEIIALKE